MMLKFNIVFKILISGIIAFMSLCMCQRESHEINPGIKVHFNKLNIIWNGLNRLNGGIPALENAHLKYHEVHTVEKDSVFIFEFIHNFEDHVKIKAVISSVKNSIILYLSPNNYHTQKASDFVGILFEEVPDMTAGLAFNGEKYEIKTSAEIKPDHSELLLFKYTDGKYTLCLPLTDHGYKTSAGKYKEKLGFKSYHSLDGQETNDIPIAALAFGEDPQTMLNVLLSDPLVKTNKIGPDFVF